MILIYVDTDTYQYLMQGLNPVERLTYLGSI